MTPTEKQKARDRARAYYYANKERCLERAKAWRAANKDKVKAYNAAYHEEHRDRENARSQAWKDAHRESMNARRREKYALNIDQERARARIRKRLKYSINPQKYRELASIERAKPGYKLRQAFVAQAWAERNRHRTRAAAKRWYQRNLIHARIQLAISQASRRQRRVGWGNTHEISAIYAQAAKLTRDTGRRYVVDHIIPLKGKNVSGLHVAGNLRVIEQSENARKSNKWEPSDVDVITGATPESNQSSQLTLF